MLATGSFSLSSHIFVFVCFYYLLNMQRKRTQDRVCQFGGNFRIMTMSRGNFCVRQELWSSCRSFSLNFSRALACWDGIFARSLVIVTCRAASAKKIVRRRVRERLSKIARATEQKSFADWWWKGPNARVHQITAFARSRESSLQLTSSFRLVCMQIKFLCVIHPYNQIRNEISSRTTEISSGAKQNSMINFRQVEHMHNLDEQHDYLKVKNPCFKLKI